MKKLIAAASLCVASFSVQAAIIVPEYDVEAGQKIYRAGIAAKGVAACTACHSPTGIGNASAAFPAVSGQHSAYVEKQLKMFRNAERSNDPNNMMRDIAAKLSDAEIKAVSAYIQGLN